MEIFKLFGSIFIENDKANKSIDSTGKKAEGLGGKLGGIISKGALIGGAILGGATVAGTALFNMAGKASEAAAEIDDIAQRTGLANDTLQEFKHAAEMSGFGIETIEGAAKKLTKKMADVKDGSKGATEAFKRLGISVMDANGNLKSTDEIFPEVMARLADMGNETERNALAMDIFGKSAMDMAPLLNGGSDGIKNLTDEAHKLGLVMSDEAVSAGAQFDDQMVQVKSSMGALGRQIGTALLPILNKFLKFVIDNMPKVLEKFDELTNYINTTVKPTFQALYDFLKPLMPLIKGVIVDNIERSFYWIDKSIKALGVLVGWLKDAVSWFDKLTGAKEKSGAVKVNQPKNPRYQGNLAGLAEGGTITSAGSVMVGERGPEILNLPRNASVTPLDKATPTIVINNPTLLNRQMVQELSDMIVSNWRLAGINPR